jgi:putative membrane protein
VVLVHMMAGAMSAWILLWIFLGIAVIAGGGVLVARALAARREPERPQIPADTLAVQAARDALKLRYARGEISREEYLQGKVELEE